MLKTVMYGNENAQWNESHQKTLLKFADIEVVRKKESTR